MATGTVKWFQNPYGFIEQDDGPDCFVHYTDIKVTGHRTLKIGQQVTFDVFESPKGCRALNVTIVTETIDRDEDLPVSERYTGTIKWFHRVSQYGFIQPDRSTKTVFFHISQWRGGGAPRENTRVNFQIVNEVKGPKAIDITLLPPGC